MKKYMFAPGPTEVPADIVSEMSKPLLYHAEEDFYKIMEEIQGGLRALFQTENPVLMLTGSGSLAMQESVANLFKKGDKVLVCVTGRYGRNWVKICTTYGLDVIIAESPLFKPVDVNFVHQTLKRHEIKGVLVQHVETTTGIRNDVMTLGRIVKEFSDTILVVDAVASLLTEELCTDLWNLDCVIAASQKGLMLPPGLAFMVLSEKAERFVGRSDLPKFYFDVKEEFKRTAKYQTRFTPAIPIVYGLYKTLQKIEKQKGSWIICSIVADAIRQSLKGIGLEIKPDKKSYSANMVTVVMLPEGIKGSSFTQRIKNNFNIIIGGGQDDIKDKVFRIGHFGYDLSVTDIPGLLFAIERTLDRFKYRKFELGQSLRIFGKEYGCLP